MCNGSNIADAGQFLLHIAIETITRREIIDLMAKSNPLNSKNAKYAIERVCASINCDR